MSRATETETSAVHAETPTSPSRLDIFSRLQRYGGTVRDIMLDPGRSKLLRTYREQDDEKNARTEPPADELIELRCIWATELYMPSQMPLLYRGFEQLGWNTRGTTSEHDPKRWLQRYRETGHGGGWFDLGPIHRAGDERFFGRGRTAPLPAEADYALAAMYTLTKSITCIVTAFILDEKLASRLDNTLRLKRRTYPEPLAEGGYRLLEPGDQKSDDVQAIRAELREIAANWFRTHLPGIFASGLLQDEFPTCEFVTLHTAQPFPKEDERDHQTEEWLRLLDIDHDIDAWEADGMPGLKFAWPHFPGGKSRFHAIVAAKQDAFSADELLPYGGGGKKSYVGLYVDRRVNGLLSRWALLGMLTGFERHLKNIRDSATFKPTQKGKPLHLLRELSDHISQSVDVGAVSAELRRFARQEESFADELDTFKPSNPRLYSNKDVTLSEALRKQAEERSEWLENLDRSVRDFLTQSSNILSASEEIKRQRWAGSLTWLSVIFLFSIAAFTALTIYSI